MQNNTQQRPTNGAKNDPLQRGHGGEVFGNTSPLPGAPYSSRFAGEVSGEYFASPQPEEGGKREGARGRRGEGEKEKCGVGQPRVLDVGKKGVICGMIAMGVSRRRAARYVGCHHQTIANEAKRDPQFETALREAEMNAEMEPLSNIYAASSRSWRACAWLLKKLRPSDYSGRPSYYQMVQHDDDTREDYLQGYER